MLVTDAYGASGGIAKVNRDLIEALAGAGVRVVALPRLQPGPPGVLPPHLAYHAEAAGGKAAFLRALARVLRRERPFDLVVCGHLHLLAPAAAAARLSGARLLLVVHGVEAWQRSPHRLANRLARRVDRCVAVSEHSLRRFAAWSGLPPERATVIPNAVDLRRFTPGPRRPDLVARYGLAGRKVVLTLGRLESEARQKGFDPTLEALPALARRVPEVAYVVAGAGPDRERLERKAAALGAAGRVVFTGFVPEEDKPDLYRLADAFSLPSRGEGFGIVLLEAMASGVPVVASTADAGRETLRDGALGRLVDPADRPALVDALADALAAPKGAVPDGLEAYSEAAFRTRWRSVLEEMGMFGGRRMENGKWEMGNGVLPLRPRCGDAGEPPR